MTKKKLGKGLDALLSRPTKAVSDSQAEQEQAATSAPPQSVTEIAVALIKPSPFQPRRVFTPAALDELATSIQHHGVLPTCGYGLHITSNDFHETVLGPG